MTLHAKQYLTDIIDDLGDFMLLSDISDATIEQAQDAYSLLMAAAEDMEFDLGPSDIIENRASAFADDDSLEKLVNKQFARWNKPSNKYGLRDYAEPPTGVIVEVLTLTTHTSTLVAK